MTTVLAILTIQALLGAFDNLWHHELQADLGHQPSARRELALHTVREFLYALIFGGVAWFRWEGAWAWLLITVLATEALITIWDFVEEDRSRKLPPLERVLHTILALSYGSLLALWAPELAKWLAAPTGFTRVDYGLFSGLLTLFCIGVLVWGLHDLRAVSRLAVPQWRRHPLRAGHNANPRVVLVTGATGFIGSALVRSLIERGDRVIALSRNVVKARDGFGPLVEVVGDLRDIERHRRIDAIVNLAGEPLVGGLWTARRRQRFIDSRVQTTRAVVALIGRLRDKPAVLVSGSAIGWYGERGDEVLAEGSARGEGFLSELCRQWEDAAMQAVRPSVRICCLRIGLVLGANGGVLKPLAMATRFGGGMVMGSGRQWQSWIHLDDLVRLIEHVIAEPSIAGPVNAVSPQRATQREVARTLGRVLRRPVFLRLPEALLRYLAGDMAELFLISQRVVPARAIVSGFRFRWAKLDAALDDLLNKPIRHGDAAAIPIQADLEESP